MERSEPSLIPEWLRSSGSGTGSGGSSLQFASSQSDGPLLALPKRNLVSKNSSSNSDVAHSSFPDRSSSSSRRTVSSNGSSKHDKSQYSRSYSNFGRSHRDRERGRLHIDDRWDSEYSDPLCIITSRSEKDTLRRSQSLVSRKPGEGFQRRVYLDVKNTDRSSQDTGSGSCSVGARVGTGMEKVAFERDFPSLGPEERPVTPDISRVPSPGLSRSVHSLSIGSSAVNNEGWTSVLAEVPTVGGSTTASAHSNVSSSAALNATVGLNMAEALVQSPSRSNSAQQPFVQNQKREELAVLQSIRLIPMTASTPKNAAPNSSDKLKPKAALKSVEPASASKNGLQLPTSQLGSQMLRGGNVKPEGSKTTLTGKLLVLKPGRENGASHTLKDHLSPVSSPHSNVGNGQGVGVSSSPSVPAKSQSNYKAITSTKASTPFIPGSIADKKPGSAQSQSRNDFFNLMRKKSLKNTSDHAEPKPVASPVSGESDELHQEMPNETESLVNNDAVKCNGDICTVSQRFDVTSDSDLALYPDEEEAAFLRSLGWEENADDEGLTEEEINAFYEEYKKLRPASKLCRGLQMKVVGQHEPQVACSSAASSQYGGSGSSA